VRWLAPLGALYGNAMALRASLYSRNVFSRSRLAGPVISVGNLSVGGSGKTPVVARVAEILRDEGLPVAILSRGYRGSFRGEALVVGDGSAVLADAALAGDEPVMLARALKDVVVAVGPRRDRVGRAVEARFGPRVHVLDDGFQHLRLARDLDLVCVAPGDLSDVPLPAGRLREAPAALDRADAILFVDAEAPPAGLARHVDAFRVSRRVLGFFDLGGEARPKPVRPFLLSGIARPERFEADVRARAGSVAGIAAFPDHHRFTAGEVRDALDRARATGADAVVTTAKDAVRLPAAIPADLPLLVLRIEVEIADAPRFRDRLLAAARRAA
jgi:tetraacyldisaccharide 4'-kinase